jgi:hypothetical protein
LLADLYLIKEMDTTISFTNPVLSLGELDSIRSNVADNLKSIQTASRGTTVYLLDSSGTLVNSFPAITSLASHLNTDRDTIKTALNYGNFIKGTSYIVSTSSVFPGVKVPSNKAQVCVICDLDGTIITEVPSIVSSAQYIDVSESTVRERLNTGLHIKSKYLVYTKSFYDSNNK